MYYEVGTRIDLSHLNKKVEVAPAVTRKSSVRQATRQAAERVNGLVEVGTTFVFDKATGKFARRIQVQFA